MFGAFVWLVPSMFGPVFSFSPDLQTGGRARTKDRLSLKLELMSHACLRWHQDNYVARAIVSYNCCGTEYIHHDHDFWELNNCGNNDCVVRDRAQVLQAGVGDMRGGGFLVKGKLFPGVATGLVHRSPDPVYHADGVTAKTRLVLKVDVYGPPDAYVLQIAR
ncbi:unnamed protein product [Prorocentrum cordatum]|uniref:Uncharacterized protein n=1 Tax=Prorocentrum cordatum TaxID=2364126 RepID=A0ABN9VRH2_9DINO|nr:unnamed protein product [Polarella glacialis]